MCQACRANVGHRRAVPRPEDMRTCERCTTQFVPAPGSAGRFCSRRCYEATADAERQEEAARLRRIEAAAPPASSFDGRVQRWRDERDEYEVKWNGGEGLTSF
jgi:hypothetical protein